jgi:hypothetical protein
MTEHDTITGPRGAEPGEPAGSPAARPSPIDEDDNVPASPRRRPSTLPSWWVVVVAVVGLVLVAAAAIDLTVGDAGSQLAILVVAGVSLLVLPLFLDRMTSVGLGPSGFRFELSREIAEHGAVSTALLLDRSAGGLPVAAEVYSRVHARGLVEEHPSERELRIRLQDELVGEASISARLHKYDAGEVRRLFRDGSPVVRVLVLGLMLGDHSLASVNVLRSAIAEPRTGNEQYHGLVLANRLKHRLNARTRAELTEIIRNDAAIWRGTSRRAEARRFVGDAIADAATARHRDGDDRA